MNAPDIAVALAFDNFGAGILVAPFCPGAVVDGGVGVAEEREGEGDDARSDAGAAACGCWFGDIDTG